MPVRVLSSVPHHAELMAWFGKSVCVQVRDGAGASRALDVPEFFQRQPSNAGILPSRHLCRS